MAKFDFEGKRYKPKCNSCNSSNVTLVHNTKGYLFRCNKCKHKTRFYPDLKTLVLNPGMFSPNPVMNVKVDEELCEVHKKLNNKLTKSDIEFLKELQTLRSEEKPTAIWTLFEDRYEPCWEELAEAWELYDPVTKTSLAFTAKKVEDCGHLKSIPVKKMSSELTNSTFITKSEAELCAKGLDGVKILEQRLSTGDSLLKLLEIVNRINWAKYC